MLPSVDVFPELGFASSYICLAKAAVGDLRASGGSVEMLDSSKVLLVCFVGLKNKSAGLAGLDVVNMRAGRVRTGPITKDVWAVAHDYIWALAQGERQWERRVDNEGRKANSRRKPLIDPLNLGRLTGQPGPRHLNYFRGTSCSSPCSPSQHYTRRIFFRPENGCIAKPILTNHKEEATMRFVVGNKMHGGTQSGTGA